MEDQVIVHIKKKAWNGFWKTKLGFPSLLGRKCDTMQFSENYFSGNDMVRSCFCSGWFSLSPLTPTVHHHIKGYLRIFQEKQNIFS
jgi:hypothetical protein